MARQQQIRINNQIRAKELRVITDSGENIGVIPVREALKKAEEMQLDLVEISPNARPPIAKITDYGKFLYDQKKKQKQAKQKAHTVEVKSIQVKIGTDENDLSVKAKKASKWLSEGHRVKVELFLPGRTKYMDKSFLEERLNRVLKLITTDFKVADPIKKNPKGLALIIENSK
ncbi:translation initiation factor IF-3 [Candidatus Parcubacteria bacterium]|nr:translation initiation factor IF-3 [Candidatus Parcubacteria bacterium]